MRRLLCRVYSFFCIIIPRRPRWFLFSIKNSFFLVNCYLDVDNRLPPKPKPRTVLQCQLDSAAEKSVEKLITIEPSCRSEVSSRHVKRASPIRRSNLENLSEDVMSEESSGKFSKCNTSTVVEWDHREEEITFGDRLTTNNDNNNNKKTETGKNKLLFRKTGAWINSE